MKKNRNKKNEEGFVLPLSVLLMVVLTISGMNFLHFDFLEKRSVLTELDNQGAFYLASAGIERARESFKAPPPDYKWTSVLNDPTKTDTTYPNPWSLCPFYTPATLATNRGCVIPPFGASAVSPDFPFGGTFDDGSYQVRAFNNNDDTGVGTTDTDGKLTYRAMGLVRGQQKLLELQGVQVKTGTKLVNCQNSDPSVPCPEPEPEGSQNKNTDFSNMEGQDPASFTGLPEFLPNSYRLGDPNAVNLPCTNQFQKNGDITLVSGTPKKNSNEVMLNSDTCYYATGNISISSVGPGWTNVVIFSDKNLNINNNNGFGNSILIGVKGIDISGSFSIVSPRTQTSIYPALVTTGSITGLNRSITIDGNVYAASDIIDNPNAPKTGSIGTDKKPLNPNLITGAVFGDNVYVKSGAQSVSDANNPIYYTMMPGFKYPPELLTNVSVDTNGWREIE